MSRFGPVRVVGVFVLVVVYRLLAATYRYVFLDRAVFEEALDAGPTVLAFWHGDQIPVFAIHRHRPIDGLASNSRDGELVARCGARLGYGVIRGSGSEGGRDAIRLALLSLSRGRSVVLAVDGPRGPRHEPHFGALRIAGESECPLVYVVAVAPRAWRLKSWDRMVIPWPFSKVYIGYGQMRVESVDRSQLAPARDLLKARMGTLGQRLRQISSHPCPAPVSTLDG